MIVDRWALEEDFLPSSSQDVLRYLEVMGYPIPKDPKTKKPTTGEMELLLLLDKLEREGRPKDLVLPKVLAGRKLKKGRGYLLDTILGRDGRMHPEFTFLPETGRLSARNPNFMNQPQGRISDDPPEWEVIEKKIAEAIRSTVVASPGHILIECDWRSMEAMLLSYFANDPDYARISRLGAHAYLLSHIIGKPASLDWSDTELKRYLDGLKKDKKGYHTAKTANLADTYDVGVRKLAKVLNCSLARAQEIKEIRKAAFPKIAKWQLETRVRAHFEGKLMNPFGYVQYFFNVFEPLKEPDRNGKTWRLGEQSHECLAFLPQSTNAAMLREVLLDVHRELSMWIHVLVPIHDALLVEVALGREAEAIAALREVMCRPWVELGGLSVEVDSKVGLNWNEMKEWKQ